MDITLELFTLRHGKHFHPFITGAHHLACQILTGDKNSHRGEACRIGKNVLHDIVGQVTMAAIWQVGNHCINRLLPVPRIPVLNLCSITKVIEILPGHARHFGVAVAAIDLQANSPGLQRNRATAAAGIKQAAGGR